jgi:hypothetical protein
VAFGRGQVDEPAFAQQVDAAAVGHVYSSTNSRTVRRDGEISSRAGMSISTLKWPVLATMAPSFMTSKCSRG